MKLLAEYHDDPDRKYKHKSTAKRILFSLLDDLRLRMSLGEEWDMLDDDVKEEYLQERLEIIERCLGQDD